MKRNKPTKKNHPFQKNLHRNRYYKIVKVILHLGSILSNFLRILGIIYINWFCER